jgi:HrpA-like RNA helicase
MISHQATWAPPHVRGAGACAHTTQLGNTADILVFLTGEEEIEEACRKITKECGALGDKVGQAMRFILLGLTACLLPCAQLLVASCRK